MDKVMEKGLRNRLRFILFFVMFVVFVLGIVVMWAGGGGVGSSSDLVFPLDLGSYNDSDLGSIVEILRHRIGVEPFNLVVSLIFLCAIIHTFISSRILAIAHRLELRYDKRKELGEVPENSVDVKAELLHYIGEVEAIFGIWVVVLGVAITLYFGDAGLLVNYLSVGVHYTEPMFVVVIMTLASTRPILHFSERIMALGAGIYSGNLASWWFSILTLGPILGSFITEPAAMTISALLLANKFYDLGPSNKLKYATLGLLFVNVSVGGTLSHFAAPPVLMVSAKWGWGLYFMFMNFGYKAFLGIVVANVLYYMLFRKEFSVLQDKYSVLLVQRELEEKFINRSRLEEKFGEIEYRESKELDFWDKFEAKADSIKRALEDRLRWHVKGEDIDEGLVIESFDKMFDEVKEAELRKTLPGLLPKDRRPRYVDPDWNRRKDKVPAWVIVVHLLFLVWTVVNAHYPVMFVGGFLFFLGFSHVTAPYQNRLDLRPALLVGFFLAGLVIHGGLQGWWIAPVLSNLSELPLMIGAMILTAFNDNAAVTYLSTLVPNFSDSLKYAVVAGAVAGGGLTVIANAPNPAGQSILKKYFKDGVSPLQLAIYAIIPTIIMGLCFILIG